MIFTARIAKIAFAVELPDVPGCLFPDAIDCPHEIAVGGGVRRLLKFPKIFAESGDRRRRVEDNFGAIEAKDARSFWEMAVVANIDADASEFRVKNQVPSIARREIKLLPKARSNLRDVVLPIFAEVFSIRVDHGRGVEEQTRHLTLVDGNHNHHSMFLGELFHALGGGAVGYWLGELVPTDLLFSAEVRAIEKLLKAKDLSLLLGGGFDQLLSFFSSIFLLMSLIEYFSGDHSQ